jgi:hypothetical protein
MSFYMNQAIYYTFRYLAFPAFLEKWQHNNRAYILVFIIIFEHPTTLVNNLIWKGDSLKGVTSRACRLLVSYIVTF